MNACQVSTFGNVKTTGTFAPKTALARSRCRLEIEVIYLQH